MANGFAQAGDFFARAMKKQEQAASWQAKAQLPTMVNFAGTEQNIPGYQPTEAAPQTVLPSLQSAATGSSLRESPEIVSELLSKAKAKRAQTVFDQTGSSFSAQPMNGYTPQVSSAGTSVVPSAKGQRMPSRPGRSVRAGQISA